MAAHGRPRGPGDGWVVCACGHRHWGVHGAAGLLLSHRDPSGAVAVLLQHRAPWVHLGDTWSTPGGARRGGEPAVAAAFREVSEETGLSLLERATVLETYVDDHGGWSYSTVCAALPEPIEVLERNEVVPWTERGEQQGLRWVPVADVAGLSLHPGFAATWPWVRRLVEAVRDI
jgi:8-oxo-dGTP pyrophosphatase MutT (NUDIX family)